MRILPRRRDGETRRAWLCGPRTTLALALVLLAWAAAGCGGESDERDAGGSPSAGAPLPGGALSVEQALASDSNEPLLVTGGLFVETGRVRLCSGFAESYPPQCAGESLEVRGLDLATVEKLRTEGSLSWSDDPVQLLGTIEGKVLTVSENAAAG